MEKTVEQYKDDCMVLCNRLLYAQEENRDDADHFCSGDLHKAYVSVNDKLTEQIQKIKTKIANL